MKLFVPLSLEELDRLCEVARAERRRPRDQAALLLVEALGQRMAGSPPAPSRAPLTFEQPTSDREPVEAVAR